MKYTENLGLKKPEMLENVLVEDLNENFDKIDEEIAKITGEETGVQAQLTQHLDKIASTEKLGHIKPDGTTITVDPSTGIASASATGGDTRVYSGDLDNLLETGNFYCDSSNTTNLPINGSSSGRPWLITSVFEDSKNTGLQIATQAINDTNFYFRKRTITGNWLEWSNLNEQITTTLTPSGQNGWNVNNTKYYKDGQGIVHLHLLAVGGGAQAILTTLTTLPVGYRPITSIGFVATTLNAAGTVATVIPLDINVNDGTVKTQVATSGAYTISAYVAYRTR